uniref:Prothymosin alpha n=1 Tax=Bos mutus grunniens TaxID=30521 RepID=A0A8B9Y8C2_BOSMU
MPALESPRCTNTPNVNAWHEAHSSAGFGGGRLGWVGGEGVTSPKTRGTQNWTRIEDVGGGPVRCIGSPECPIMSDAAVDTSSEITTKDLKEKKEVVEEAENGREAPANGNANEENGEQEADNEVDEEEEEGGEEEEEEEEGDGEEEDGDEDEEAEAATGKRAAEDDEDDDVDTKKQKTDEDD